MSSADDNGSGGLQTIGSDLEIVRRGARTEFEDVVAAAVRPLLLRPLNFTPEHIGDLEDDRALSGEPGWEALNTVARRVQRELNGVARGFPAAQWWIAIAAVRDQFGIDGLGPVRRACTQSTKTGGPSIANLLTNGPTQPFLSDIESLITLGIELNALASMGRRVAKGQTVTLSHRMMRWSPVGDDLDRAISLLDERRRANPFPMGAVIGTFGDIRFRDDDDSLDAVPMFNHIGAEPLSAPADSAQLPRTHEPHFVTLTSMRKLAAPSYATPGFTTPASADALRAVLIFAFERLQDQRGDAPLRALLWRRWGLLEAQRPTLDQRCTEIMIEYGWDPTVAYRAVRALGSPGAHRVVVPSGKKRALVNLVAASGAIQEQYVRPIDGAQANLWGADFERQLRSELDRTGWAPNGSTRDLVGKSIKRVDGSVLTDIDAVADTGTVILLIDAKSWAVTEDILAGSPRQTETRRRNSEKAAIDWQQRVEHIRAHPSLLGVNLPTDREIDGIVVMPDIPFVHLGTATEVVTAGLRRISSVTELLRAAGARSS